MSPLIQKPHDRERRQRYPKGYSFGIKFLQRRDEVEICSFGKHYKSHIYSSTVPIVLESDGIGMATRAICRFAMVDFMGRVPESP